MSTEAETTQNSPNEVIEVQGNKLIETVKGIIAQENVSRLIVYWANGDKLLDIPYPAGLTMMVLVNLFLAPLAALTPIALLLGRFKIEIVRPEGEERRASEEATSEPEGQVEMPSDSAPAEEPEPDQLRKITGIGKVFEGRLHEAGIYTFAQLAETPREKIKEIVSPDKADQLFDVEPWITQARQLAGIESA